MKVVRADIPHHFQGQKVKVTRPLCVAVTNHHLRAWGVLWQLHYRQKNLFTLIFAVYFIFFQPCIMQIYNKDTEWS